MEKQTESTPIMQQIGMLNLRINDMMTQLNVVLKTLMDENTTLKAKNMELQCPVPEKTPEKPKH
jgi:regulator of replication initiation timing